MKLSIPIKKYVFDARTKNDFITQFERGNKLYFKGGIYKDWSWDGAYRTAYYSSATPDIFFGINCEKYRPKRGINTKAKRVRDREGNLKHPRKIVREGYWKFTVYAFPAELLKMAGVKIKQNARNFELVPVKI